MTNLEKGVAVVALASAVFTAGASWNSINARFDRMDERLKAIETDKGQSLCLTILTRQVVAVEKGNQAVRQQLQALSDQFCPKVSAYTNANATRPATAEEIRQQQDAEQRRYRDAAEQLHKINEQLNAYVETH